MEADSCDSNMASCQLNSGDITEVRRVLWDARSKWYDIGVELKLKAGDLDAIKQTHINDVEKCLTEMILQWLRRVEPHPPSWTALCAALQKPAVARCDIAKKVQELSINSTSRTELSLSITQDHMATFPAPTHSNTQKGFNCPCSKCNWEDYLQNRNQCQSRGCYPGLDVRSLNEYDRKRLGWILSQDATGILTSFSDLYLGMINSLEERKVDPKKVARTITSIAPAEILSLDRLKSIEVTDSIDSVLGPLQHKYITFFDHYILKYIIRHHGSEEDKKKLDKFLKDFDEYCKRSVFEVPQAIFGEIPNESKTFIIKIDEKHFSDQFSLHDLKAVECKLADALNIDVCNLSIRTVDRGCIKVIASIPISIADITLSRLESNHYIEYLKTKGVHIMPGPPGKPEALYVSATAITLCWTKPEYGANDIQRYIISYKIRINNSMVNTWESVQTSDDAPSFNFEVDHYISDKENVSLVFKINTMNEYGEGVESTESDVVELVSELKPFPRWQCNVHNDSYQQIKNYEGGEKVSTTVITPGTPNSDTDSAYSIPVSK